MAASRIITPGRTVLHGSGHRFAFVETLLTWLRDRREAEATRLSLSRLTDQQLQDIGLTRSDAATWVSQRHR